MDAIHISVCNQEHEEHCVDTPIMDNHQKHLISLAIDSFYVSARELQAAVIPATIYSEPASMRGRVNVILQKLEMANVDIYASKCRLGSCLRWTGYKSRGYPQIKYKNERHTVTQILALLFLERPSSDERKLKRNCPEKDCVNIFHYSYEQAPRPKGSPV